MKSKEESWKILEFPRPHPRPSTRPNEIALPGLGERGRLKLLVGIAHQNLAVKSRVHLSAAPATPMYQENHAEAAQCGAADGNKRDRLSLDSSAALELRCRTQIRIQTRAQTRARWMMLMMLMMMKFLELALLFVHASLACVLVPVGIKN